MDVVAVDDQPHLLEADVVPAVQLVQVVDPAEVIGTPDETVRLTDTKDARPAPSDPLDGRGLSELDLDPLPPLEGREGVAAVGAEDDLPVTTVLVLVTVPGRLPVDGNALEELG